MFFFIKKLTLILVTKVSFLSRSLLVSRVATQANIITQVLVIAITRTQILWNAYLLSKMYMCRRQEEICFFSMKIAHFSSIKLLL